MPYHVVVNQINTFGQTLVDVPPVQDNWIGIQNNHFFPHLPLYLYGGWAGGVNLTAVQLVTPRSRMIVPPRLIPLDAFAQPGDRPHIIDRRKNPFTLNAVEEVMIQMTVGGAANALNTLVEFWGTSLDPVPQGDVYTLHGTSATAAIASRWTAINIVWDQTLPAGSYAVIASQHQSATAVCHRIFFKDQLLRPGFLSLTSLTNMTDPSYYFGGWGLLGTFNTTAYPQFEVFCNAADAAHDTMMSMVRVG